MAEHPIPHVEIPRPPVPQPPERLFLFVCDSEEPDPPGRFWGTQQAYMGQGIAGTYPTEPKRPAFRRATADDLHVFGFVAVPPGIPEDPSQGELAQVVCAAMDRLSTGTRRTVMALLQEKYG